MHVITRQHALDDLDAILRANLTANIANSQFDITPKHLVAILGRPNEVIAVVVDAMLDAAEQTNERCWKLEGRSGVKGLNKNGRDEGSEKFSFVKSQK